MKTFSLNIIACERDFFKGRVTSLTIPVIDGEMGILADHEEMFLAVEIGELHYTKENGEKVSVAVSKGFAEIANNRARILVETVELPEEIDINRAKEAKERAEEELRQKQSIQEYYRTQANLSRAMSRLKESQKHN